MKSYTQITTDINRGIAKIRESTPEALAGFGALAREAMRSGELSELHKELIALAIAVAGHCDGCIGFHARNLVRLGASRAQFMETLAVAVYMGGGPSLMYAADATLAYEEFLATSTATTPIV